MGRNFFYKIDFLWPNPGPRMQFIGNVTRGTLTGRVVKMDVSQATAFYYIGSKDPLRR